MPKSRGRRGSEPSPTIRRACGLAAVLAIACVGPGCAPSRPSDDVQFRVTESRLGARFAARAFEVRAPRGWSAVPDSTIDRAMRVAEIDPVLRTGPRLRAVYQSSDGAALAISEFPLPSTPHVRDSLSARIERGLRAQYPAARIAPGRFRYHGLDLTQLMVSDSSRVLFKLLVERPGASLYQLDYLIPRGIYRRELESVESSIGSLQMAS